MQAQLPYSDYRLYRIFHKKEGRFYAALVSPTHRTTIAWAKYILEVHLGRKLKIGHVAHHKDENKTNDVITNLEEKLQREHLRDHNRRPISHGKPGGYRRGCRCVDCTEAQKQCRKRWSDKQRIGSVAQMEEQRGS